MRPHTAAYIAFINYLYVKSGDFYSVPAILTKAIRFEVKSPRMSGRQFDVKLRRISSSRLELEIENYWSCVAEVSRSGRNFEIEHRHSNNTGTVESFELYPGENVSRGYHKNSRSPQQNFASSRIARSLSDFSSGSQVLELIDTDTKNMLLEVFWKGEV